MKKINKIVLTVEEVLSNKPFGYFVLILAIAGLFPPMTSWDVGENLSQLFWPSLVKIFIALPFTLFHLLQMVAHKEISAYPGIEPKKNIFNLWTVVISYTTYILGTGFLFWIPLAFKFVHLYMGAESNDERKPISTWWVWDIVAVIAVAIIAYKIPNPITMEDILGY